MIYQRKNCPLCLSKDFKIAYKIPFGKVKNYKVEGRDTDYYPLIGSETLDYCLCNNCESIFVKNIDLDYYDGQKQKYDLKKIEHSKERRNWPIYEKMALDIKKHITNGDLLIDVACGTGDFMEIAKKEMNFKEIIGIDCIKEFTDFVASKGFKVINSDFEKLDVKEFYGKVDLIVFSEAMEHVLNPLAAIEKIKMLLKRGGTLYLTCQNNEKEELILSGENIYASKKIMNEIFKQYDKRLFKEEDGRFKCIYKKI